MIEQRYPFCEQENLINFHRIFHIYTRSREMEFIFSKGHLRVSESYITTNSNGNSNSDGNPNFKWKF